jgi:hypothetical protein
MMYEWTDLTDLEVAQLWLDDIRSGNTEGDGIVALARLPFYEPERTWNVALEILNLLNDDEQLLIASVGAGPLESLLKDHGPDYIDRFIECARRDRRFRVSASSIWPSRINTDIWRRLQAVVQSSGPTEGASVRLPKDRPRKR